MTLTRPAYRATVTSLAAGWSHQVTAGDPYNPAANVWLADGLELAWRFADQVPSQLEPETAKFRFLVDGIANLPPAAQGDRVAVILDRPGQLIANPSFEDDLTDWSEFNGTLCDVDVITSAVAFHGDKVARVTCTADTTAQIGVALLNPDGRVPVAAGDTVQVSAYFRAITTARPARVSVTFYDAANTLIATTSGAQTNVPNGAWTRLAVSAVAPAGAVTARLIAVYVGGAAGAILGYIDAAMVTIGGQLTDFSPVTSPVYMDFVGRISDTKLTIHAATGRLLLEVVAVDPTSELVEKVGLDEDYVPDPTNTPIDHLLNSVVVPCPANYARLEPDRWSYGFNLWAWVPAEVQAYADYVEGWANAAMNTADGYPVMRYALDPITAPGWVTYRSAAQEEFGPGGIDTSPIPEQWTYYLARWRHAVTGAAATLFSYAYSTADGDRVTLVGADAAGGDAITVLDACHVPDIAEFFQDRRIAPNTIQVQAYISPSGDETALIAKDRAEVTRRGTIARNIEPALALSTNATLAGRYLALSAPAGNSAWLVDAVELLAEVMTDAELDTYATQLWTPREPVPADMGKPVVLANIDETVDPTGGLLFAFLTGVTYTCSGGELRLGVELAPAPVPAMTAPNGPDSPSYDEFGASTYGTATYHNQGGTTDYIDTALTYNKAKFARLAA